MQLKEYASEKLKEKIFHGIHESGLKVYILPKSGYSKSYAIFATNYGSIDSKFIIPGEGVVTEVPDGIAHFLEHKLFEEEDGNVFNKFLALGSSPNAFTSFNNTAYIFSCTSNFYKNLNILLNYVQNPYFTDENVEKEQGIIAQEIRMYEDDPNWRVFFNFLDGLYHEHPVKKDIVGTVESISKISKETLYKCYNTFYNPSNMILFVIGEIDVNEVVKMVESNIKIKNTNDSTIERIYPDEPKNINKPLVEQKLSISMPLFQMGFKDISVGYDGNRLLKKDIITNIILEMIMGKSSELYQRLYEKGLINDTFSFDFTSEKDYAFTAFGGESSNPEKVREEIINEILELRKVSLDEKIYDRIKKVIFSRYIRQFNNIEKLANNFVFSFFKNINLFDYLEVYNDISFDDVTARFMEHFQAENCVLSVIRPIK